MDFAACRDHMRTVLQDEFRGPLGAGEATRTSMTERLGLYQRGEVERESVWGLRPEREFAPRTWLHWESRGMLDAAGVLVRAVHSAMPPALIDWLQRHPNSNTHDGQYRPLKRYLTQHERKHYLCILFRNFHSKMRPGQPNRKEGELLRQYLPPVLAARGIQQLLQEFRGRHRDFGPPFPAIPLTEADYRQWQRAAVLGVREMLRAEAGL